MGRLAWGGSTWGQSMGPRLLGAFCLGEREGSNFSKLAMPILEKGECSNSLAPLGELP